MHIGVIPDGNRRYMEKKGVSSLFSSYDMGITQFHDFLTWCQNKNVDEVTIYALSLENIVNRDKLEIKTLLSVFNENAKNSLKDERIHENRLQIRICGDKKKLTEIEGVGDLGKALLENLQNLEEATREYDNLKLNLAIGYGGRQEIVAAARKTVDEGKSVTEENIEANLWVSSCPDIIIRTAEARLSNFLTWQSAYSELYFPQKLWQEFTEEDLDGILVDFEGRQRRFGR